MSEKAITILKKIFSHTEMDENSIRQIYEASTVRTYTDKTVICHEGRHEDNFYVLLSGRVDVFRSERGASYLIGTMESGSCFGEIALIMDTPRTAEIVADGDVAVMALDRDRFNNLIRSNNNALLGIVQMVLQRMIEQETRRLHQLSFSTKSSAEDPRIFISYSRQNEDFVRRLATDLQKHHIYTWLDVFRIEAGKSWAQQIGTALDTCELMLLMVSPSMLESENVYDEWNYYLDIGKPILPIMVENASLPFRLRKYQYIDFAATPYNESFDYLIANLRSTLVSNQ